MDRHPHCTAIQRMGIALFRPKNGDPGCWQAIGKPSSMVPVVAADGGNFGSLHLIPCTFSFIPALVFYLCTSILSLRLYSISALVFYPALVFYLCTWILSL